MTIQEMIDGYREIIESLNALTEHPLEAIQSAAKIQIDRCQRSIRELENHLLG